MTAAQKANYLAYYVGNHPEGILVLLVKYVNGEPQGHSVVFTDTTHTISPSIFMPEIRELVITEENDHEAAYPELFYELNGSLASNREITSTPYDSEFTCYDPGTPYASQGKGVLYSNSWAASSYGGIDMVTAIYYFS